ncbi:hypothetical protein PBOI14_47790 [Pseudomonas sp. Boi14]|nr:hypothetical protein PBOI14_47790 [Pseudomonas sp. Boi14]
MSAYAELHCLSNFSFQRGASSAAELFQRAKALGYQALAITDECTLAGIVRAWQASRDTGLKLIVGSEMQVEDGPRLVLLVEDLAGYQGLCRLITRARRRAEKGSYRLLREDFAAPLPGLLALWLTGAGEPLVQGRWLQQVFPSACGWRWSCIAARTMPGTCNSNWPWPGNWGCRPWPVAMCTCTCAGAGRCRTP